MLFRSLLGWGSFAGDLALRSLLATPSAERGWGSWNWGKFSNAKVDELLTQAFATTDPKAREAVVRDAMAVAMANVPVIPLHHQIVSWAMRADIAYTPRTDEFTFGHLFKPK